MKRGFLGNAFDSASAWVTGTSSNNTKKEGEKQPTKIWNYVEKWMADIEVAQDKDELRNYCRDQLFGLRSSIMYTFDLFLEGAPTLLYQLEYFKSELNILQRSINLNLILSGTLPEGMTLANLSSHSDFSQYYRNNASPEVVACLQFFDTLNTYMHKSLERSIPNTTLTALPMNVEGLRHFCRSLQEINDEVRLPLSCTNTH